MKLSYRLLVIGIVGLIPIVAATAYNENALRSDREGEVHQLALASAEQASLEIKRILDGSLSILSIVAKAVGPGGSGKECQAILSQMKAELPQFTALGIFGPDGRPDCVSEQATLPQNFMAGSYFASAMVNAGQLTVGEYTVGRVSEKKTLPLATAVLRDDKATAIVVAGLDLEWLGTLLRERSLPQNGSITVADKNGTIIAREPFPERFVGTVIPDPFRSLLNESAPGSLEVTSQDGTERILGYTPLSTEPAGLYVSAGLARSAAFAAIDAARFRSVALLLVGALASLAVAWLLARQMVQGPVEKIARALSARRQNDTSARTRMSSGSGELGEIGAALDKYMDELDASTLRRARLEAQISAIYNTSPLFMGVTETSDRDVLHLYDNPASCRFFGVEPGTTSGKWALADLQATPDVVGAWLRAYRTAAETGLPQHFEHAYPGADGERYLSVTVSHVGRGDDGRERFSYVTEDVTDRRSAERAIADSARDLATERERLAIALRTGKLGVYQWRIGEEVVWWSPETYPVYGVASETFTPTLANFRELVHPDDRAELWRKTDECIRNGQVFEHEYRVVSPDGSVRWVINRSHVELSPSGEVESITGVAGDITARKLAEEGIKESEERLRVALVAGRMGTWRFDLNTGDQAWDLEQYKIFGFEPTIRPTRELFLRAVHPDDLHLVEFDRSTLPDDFLDSEFRIVRPDGAIRWIRAHSLARRKLDGSPFELIGVNLDVTDQKEWEARQRLLLAELNHRVKNTLAVVQGIARQSFRGKVDSDARESFEAASSLSRMPMMFSRVQTGRQRRSTASRKMPFSVKASSHIVMRSRGRP